MLFSKNIHRHFAYLSLLFAFPVFAQEGDGGSFGKLIFFPSPGQFFDDLSLTMANNKYTLKKSLNNDSMTKNTTEFRNSLFFSFAERNEVGMSISYEMKRESNSNFLNDDNSNGMTNPIFTYRYRALTEGSNWANFDIIVGFSPKTFQAKKATSANEGTVASGHHEFLGKLKFSGSAGGVLWSLAPAMHTFTQTSMTDATTGQETRMDAVNFFSLEADGQDFVNPVFGLDFGISFAYFPQIVSHYPEERTDTLEGRMVREFYFGFDAIVIPNALDFYLHLIETDTSDARSSTNNSSYATLNDSTTALMFGAKVLI